MLCAYFVVPFDISERIYFHSKWPCGLNYWTLPYGSQYLKHMGQLSFIKKGDVTYCMYLPPHEGTVAVPIYLPVTLTLQLCDNIVSRDLRTGVHIQYEIQDGGINKPLAEYTSCVYWYKSVYNQPKGKIIHGVRVADFLLTHRWKNGFLRCSCSTDGLGFH